jgi:copper resistance protein B
MRKPVPWLTAQAAVLMFAAAPVYGGAGHEMPDTADRLSHQESARGHRGQPPPEITAPPLPEGMSLEQVLEYSANPPPLDYPAPVPDDSIYVFTMFEKLEYRFSEDESPDHLLWEAQGWIGKDFNKFWWKHEGEAAFEEPEEGETETDLLYSRLITPFWNLQLGMQFANEWGEDEYEDRWSGVFALQGLAPYKFEVDASLYFSEDGDLTMTFETEYDLRITQRLVLQPRAEAGFAFQDIAGRHLGAGLTDVVLDLRLRYETRREFAPYAGLSWRLLVGSTADLAEAAGRDTEQLYYLAGLRFAF